MNQTKLQWFSILILGVLIGYLSFHRIDIPSSTVTLEQLVDSMKVHDENKNKQLRILQIGKSKDSMRINILQKKLSSIPDSLNKIKNIYAAKRNYINTLSIDSQINFMSTWLSKEDSNQ